MSLDALQGFPGHDKKLNALQGFPGPDKEFKHFTRLSRTW